MSKQLQKAVIKNYSNVDNFVGDLELFTSSVKTGKLIIALKQNARGTALFKVCDGDKDYGKLAQTIGFKTNKEGLLRVKGNHDQLHQAMLSVLSDIGVCLKSKTHKGFIKV